jgi:DNA-binding SARP family transcriptional activator
VQQKAGHADARLTIRLFGALEIVDGARRLGPRDLGGARPKQLLEILLAARGHHVPTDRIAEMIWDASRPDDVAASIQTFVSVLRRHLVPERERARELVVTEAEAYRFATDEIELDLDRFDELLERSSRQPTRDARRSLEQALSLVRGEVLEDEPYAAWAQDVRGSYQGRVLGARLDAADAALGERDFSAALAHTEAAVAFDRFSERAHRLSMLALYSLGRQHEALARYRSYRMLLDDELGLEPTAETRAVESAILRQTDPESLLPRPIGEPRSIGERSSPLLGRNSELKAACDAIRDALESDLTLIQIEGESGLGKTRLLDELAAELRGVRVGRADCSELERHLPYVPLATALRDALADAELDAERLPPLRAVLPELVLDTPKPEFAEVEVLEALVALIGEHAPLVLLIDDLQWADHATLAALGYLRRRGAGRRIAIVTTVAAVDASSEAVRGLKPDLLLRLEPLQPDDLVHLGIPGLHDTTGGNPRFVIEALACGEESGPSRSLAAALIAQCRAEGLWSCRVLTSAALLEQPFEPAPLARMLEVEAAALTEELERLCERRMLRVDGLGFRFRYEIVRQVLLESISPARRRLLHERLDDDGAVGGPAAVGYAVGSPTGLPL